MIPSMTPEITLTAKIAIVDEFNLAECAGTFTYTGNIKIYQVCIIHFSTLITADPMWVMAYVAGGITQNYMSAMYILPKRSAAINNCILVVTLIA